MVSEPSAVRQILIEDQSSYRKSTLERRVLSARLRNGLVAVDGEQWRRLRQSLLRCHVMLLHTRQRFFHLGKDPAHLVDDLGMAVALASPLARGGVRSGVAGDQHAFC